MEEQGFVFDAGGAFAIHHAFELALRREVVAQEQPVPISYVVVAIAFGEHPRGVGWRCHERMQNRCEETANAETLDAFAFEGHIIALEVDKGWNTR
jgi:hypothetical protein